MADDKSQHDLSESAKSSEGFFDNFRQRLRSLSKQTGKGFGVGKQSSGSSRATSPERRPSLPHTPDPSRQSFGSPSQPYGSPVQTIQRCPSGKFHVEGDCDGSCTTRLALDLESLEVHASRRPSTASSSASQPPLSQTYRHTPSHSQASSDIHALGSAQSLRSFHKRPNESVELKDPETSFPDLYRSPTYLDWADPSHPIPRRPSNSSRSSFNVDRSTEEDRSRTPLASRRPSQVNLFDDAIHEEPEEDHDLLLAVKASRVVAEPQTLKPASPSPLYHDPETAAPDREPKVSSSAVLQHLAKSNADLLVGILGGNWTPSSSTRHHQNVPSLSFTHTSRSPNLSDQARSKLAESALPPKSPESGVYLTDQTIDDSSAAVGPPCLEPQQTRHLRELSPELSNFRQDIQRHSPERSPPPSQRSRRPIFAETSDKSPERSFNTAQEDQDSQAQLSGVPQSFTLDQHSASSQDKSSDLLQPPEQETSAVTLRSTSRQESNVQTDAAHIQITPRPISICRMASRPESMMVQGGPREFKRRAIQEATLAQETINRWFATNDNPFKGKYEFKELIGKGSYGRVYKSIEKATGRYVAIKVLLPDEADLALPGKYHDINLQDAMREIEILNRLRQSGAGNVNEFVEAGTVHSQLWIVSDYCSGGSLSTLKRAAGNKLDEKYIRVIARELAKGLASVHDAGVVHRDIKCGNVMVSEEGDLRIIDFGVSGILQSNQEEDKRKTIIGTLHWMAPEIQFNPDGKEVPHGSEVDVWAYGITLYECAMGMPPNATVGQVNRLRAMARQNPPRLPDDKGFSADLKDLVAFCCNADPGARPSMKRVCEHPYVLETETEHPPHSLQALVEIYYLWERSGGNRQSLWQPGGAQQAQIPSLPSGPGQDEWVFSTTVDFDRMHEDTDDGSFDLSSSPPREADEWDEDAGISNTMRPAHSTGAIDTSQTSRAEQDAGARRGAKFMAGLFDQSAAPYSYGERPISDLPLRSGNSSSSLHRKELSVSSNDGSVAPVDLNMSAINQKKADKRATMAWKWGDNLASGDESLPPARPPLHHANTFAIGEPVTAKQTRETMDLDALMNPPNQAARQTMDLDALMNPPSQVARQTMDLDALMNTDQSVRQAARETMDLDALMNAGQPVRQAARETMDLDALMNPAGIARRTLDLDNYSGTVPSGMHHSIDMGQMMGQDESLRPENRDTLDLDALMGGPGPGAFAPSASQILPLSRTIGPGTTLQDNRQTLDLDALWMGDAAGNAGSGLEPPVAFENIVSEQTMRPLSHYPHQQHQQQQFEGHDFAAQHSQYDFQNQQPQPHAKQASQHPRPGTMDFDALSGGNLDALMAGDHDYEGPGHSSAASHGGQSLADYRTSEAADLGLSSSPPQSPFGDPLSSLPPIPNYPAPINPLVLHDGASPDLVQGELQRMLHEFSAALDLNHVYLTEATKLAPPAKHSQGPMNGNGYTHSRTTSVASSNRDDVRSMTDSADGDREDEDE